MLVLDIPRKCPSNFTYLKLPLYHRVHLGLAANTILHGCLLAGSKSPHFLPELVVSPFEFEKWDKIWRLNLTVIDRPGLFHDVCDVLRHNEAELLAAESSTTQQQNLYQLEVVFESEDDQTIEWIRFGLLTKFLREMTFLEDGEPRLRIQRLQSLWHAKRDFDDQRNWPKQKWPAGFSPEKAEVTVKWSEPEEDHLQETSSLQKNSPQNLNEPETPGHKPNKRQVKALRLLLPKSVRDVLKKTVRVRAEQDEHYDHGFYLRLSDTKNRFLRVLFFRSDDPVIHARIEYLKRTGATADITNSLKENGFNILSAYLGPGGDSQKSRLELLVRSHALLGTSASERKNALAEALGSFHPVSDLKIAIGYPQNYAHEWDSKEIKVISAQQPAHSSVNWFTSMRDLLKRQHSELENSVRIGAEPRLRPHWILAEQLQWRYNELIGASNEKVLFVSCHYKGDQLNAIRKQAVEKGFTVVSGEDLLAYNSLAFGLVNEIRRCTHFLGVWARDGAYQFGDRYWPSPWLLWEFGVAEACELTWRLLIQADIDESAWQRIAPHRQHLFFTTMDFQTQLARILEVLSALPSQRKSPWSQAGNGNRE